MPDCDEVFVLDDDPSLGDLLASLLPVEGYRATCFKDEEAFAAMARSCTPACILLYIHMPRRSGLEILRELDPRAYGAPIMVISDRATVPLVVEAMKLSAFDVLEKPLEPSTIAPRIRAAIEAWRRQEGNAAAPTAMDFPGHGRLTQRERDVLAEIVAASSNKEAAAHLGLSPRTIEVHRAHIMMKLGTKNTVDLIRLIMGRR